MLTQPFLEQFTAAAGEMMLSRPKANFYVFGSVTRETGAPSDIDILVVCDSDEEVCIARASLQDWSRRLPLHLLLMTRREEEELQFIENQQCIALADFLNGGAWLKDDAV